jgi:hypothetical protein
MFAPHQTKIMHPTLCQCLAPSPFRSSFGTGGWWWPRTADVEAGLAFLFDALRPAGRGSYWSLTRIITVGGSSVLLASC